MSHIPEQEQSKEALEKVSYLNATLRKKAKILDIQDKDIPALCNHIEKLANIIIDSYIKTKERSNK